MIVDLEQLRRPAERWPVVRTGDRDPIHWLVRLGVFMRQDFRCEQCGYRNVDRVGLELDHCIPWSAGGSDESRNLRVLCRPHNRQRSNWHQSSERRRRLPVTWWCQECWAEPEPRPIWSDGTDLNVAPDVREPRVLAFCAWCCLIAHTDFTADDYARLASVYS